MPSRTVATLSIIAVGVLAPAAVADAATKKASKFPTVKKITPMTVSMGETMTITGTGFLKGKGKNTVVFRRAGKRNIFAKADGLSSTRLSVVVPEKLRSSLAKKSGKAVSTRFQIRILAKRFGKSYTRLSKSPTVLARPSKTATDPKAAAAPAPAPAPAPLAKTDPPPPPPNCDNDAQIDALDSDDDNDLLSDALEETLQTNRCLVDTDGDGMEDGWEYKSALDLNRESCPAVAYPTPCGAVRPYPGKRAYPNPLDSTDAGSDYDGDWLTGGHEHAAWQRKGRVSASYRNLNSLWYSDGLQASQDTSSSDSCVGIAAADMPAPLMGQAAYTLDRYNRGTNGLGCLTDDERDEDSDFLTNSEETTGPLSGTDYWADVFEEPLYKVQYLGTDWLDNDTDGDSVIDGIDDQDFDDFWNVEEIRRGTPSSVTGTYTAINSGLWVDAFNPCLPAINSRTCPRYVPASGSVWRPFYREDRPTKRWPLYLDAVPTGDPEVWDGLSLGAQTMPPPHPLLPRPS